MASMETTSGIETKLECDRCGGDHASESCPHYSKTKDPPPGYDADGNKLPWLIESEQEENRKVWTKKCTNYARFACGIVALGLLSFYLYYAAYGCSQVARISESQEFADCVEEDALSTSAPSALELVFVVVMGILIIVCGLCEIPLSCCPDRGWKWMFKLGILVAGFFLVATLIDICITTHVYVYLDEVNDAFGSCLADNVDDWSRIFNIVRDAFIIQWFALLLTLVAGLTHYLYTQNDAIVI